MGSLPPPLLAALPLYLEEGSRLLQVPVCQVPTGTGILEFDLPAKQCGFLHTLDTHK